MTDRIDLSHGSGGRRTRELVEELFLSAFGALGPDAALDAAVLAPLSGRLAFTVDGFTVSPLEFPGGSIGSLSVHGTCNDLVCAGARPRFAAASFLLEEGLEIDLLVRIVSDMAAAAEEAGIRLAAGDTKVVQRGRADGVYISLSGIGEIPDGRDVCPRSLRPDDAWLVSGPVGDHGAAILTARGEVKLETPLQSDSACLAPLAEALFDAVPNVRFLRDPTRGGLAQAVVEACRTSGVGCRIQEDAIPIRPEVRSVCEILGFDSLHLACEGRLLAAVPPGDRIAALEAMRSHPLGRKAAAIGAVTVGRHPILVTSIGGERILDELEDDPVPRIC